MKETSAISAVGLTRSFGDTLAVSGIDLEIAEGSVFGLLGPDGAGKSTLMRMLATVLAPSSGTASVFGRSTTDESSMVTPRIGYMSQRFSMYPDLTVAENLDFFGTLRSVPAPARKERSARLLSSMGLAEFGHRQAQHLSGGMKQKLMLAATLMHEPDALLLDEPTTGVDPVSRREFWRIIAGLHQRGKTVVVATPYMDEAERCTEIAFIDRGMLTYRGTPHEVESLIPGRLYEVVSANPRGAMSVLRGAAYVESAHLLGDVVRVLASPGGPEGDELARLLVAAGFPEARVRPARIDMEAAFSYLAQGFSDAGEGTGA